MRSRSVWGSRSRRPRCPSPRRRARARPSRTRWRCSRGRPRRATRPTCRCASRSTSPRSTGSGRSSRRRTSTRCRSLVGRGVADWSEADAALEAFVLDAEPARTPDLAPAPLPPHAAPGSAAAAGAARARRRRDPADPALALRLALPDRGPSGSANGAISGPPGPGMKRQEGLAAERRDLLEGIRPAPRPRPRASPSARTATERPAGDAARLRRSRSLGRIGLVTVSIFDRTASCTPRAAAVRRSPQISK